MINTKSAWRRYKSDKLDNLFYLLYFTVTDPGGQRNQTYLAKVNSWFQLISFRSRILPLSKGGQPIMWPNFIESCMKMKKIGLGARSIILLGRSVTRNFIGEDLEFFTGGVPIIYKKNCMKKRIELRHEAFSAFAGRNLNPPIIFY